MTKTKWATLDEHNHLLFCTKQLIMDRDLGKAFKYTWYRPRIYKKGQDNTVETMAISVTDGRKYDPIMVCVDFPSDSNVGWERKRCDSEFEILYMSLKFGFTPTCFKDYIPSHPNEKIPVLIGHKPNYVIDNNAIVINKIRCGNYGPYHEAIKNSDTKIVCEMLGLTEDDFPTEPRFVPLIDASEVDPPVLMSDLEIRKRLIKFKDPSNDYNESRKPVSVLIEELGGVIEPRKFKATEACHRSCTQCGTIVESTRGKIKQNEKIYCGKACANKVRAEGIYYDNKCVYCGVEYTSQCCENFCCDECKTEYVKIETLHSKYLKQ